MSSMANVMEPGAGKAEESEGSPCATSEGPPQQTTNSIEAVSTVLANVENLHVQLMQASAKIIEHQVGESENQDGQDKADCMAPSSEGREPVGGNIGTIRSDAMQSQEGKDDAPQPGVDTARCSSSGQPIPAREVREPQESDCQQETSVEQALQCEPSDMIAKAPQDNEEAEISTKASITQHVSNNFEVDRVDNQDQAPDGKSLVPITHTDSETTQSEASTPSDPGREKFSGLRIMNRCISAEAWSKEMQGADRRFVPICNLYRFGSAVQGVVIAVLYDSLGVKKFASGEIYGHWELTDLAVPEPRRVTLQLRGPAMTHWLKGPQSAKMQRGALIAVLNPALVCRDDQSGVAGCEYILRIAKPGFVVKLGDCPSLAMCAASGCKMPCNADIGRQYCIVHSADADKSKRVAVASGSLKSLIQGLKQKRTIHKADDIEEEQCHAKEVADRAEAAKRIKTTVALELDNRRFASSAANDNYVRSIRGRMIQDKNSFQMPVLGRGLQNKNVIEWDFFSMDTDERRQGERILEQCANLLDRKANQDEACPNAGNQTTKQNHDSLPHRLPAEARKRSLCENNSNLNQTLKTEELTVQSLSKRSRAAGQPAKNAAPSHAPLKRSPNMQAMKAAESRIRELEVTNGSADEIRKSLELCDKIPVTALSEQMSSHLYWAVGHFALQGEPRDDIQRLAHSLRRRWRLADSDIGLKRHKKNTPPAMNGVAGKHSSRPEACPSVSQAEAGA